MKKENVLGSAQEGSHAGKNRVEVQALAEASKEKMDIDGLYAAYEKAVDDRFNTEKALLDILPILSKDKMVPNDIHAIRAMRDVAMAAIDLAKQIAVKPK